jgi:hypothetical protein
MSILKLDEFPEILSWYSSGKSIERGDEFVILDSARFETDVLVKYFNSAKYSSFTRRLRRWGFSSRRIDEKDRTSVRVYSHPLFSIRDETLCDKIVAIPQARKKKSRKRVLQSHNLYTPCNGSKQVNLAFLRYHAIPVKDSKQVNLASHRHHAMSQIWPQQVTTQSFQNKLPEQLQSIYDESSYWASLSPSARHHFLIERALHLYSIS